MKISYIVLLGLFFGGCANIYETKQDSGVMIQQEKDSQSNISSDKTKNIKDNEAKTQIVKDKTHKKAADIVSLMEKYLGKKDGKDCSGFVSFINKKSDDVYFKEKQLLKHYGKSGSKSEAIFNLYKKQNLITQTEPKMGDLIFFYNTTQKTRNLKKQKLVTHIGIIDNIDTDGTISFTHNSRGKNIISFMNLQNKNTYKIGNKELNSYIVSCKSGNISCLTSNRFAGFGKVRF